MRKPNMFDKQFGPLLGLPCWGVNWEPQLNLSMNFGKPHLNIMEPRRIETDSKRLRLMYAHRKVTVRGDWWLWLFVSRWKLSISGLDDVTSSGSNIRIQKALRLLDGQCLQQVTVDPDDGHTIFEFDLGAVLNVRAMDRSRKSDIWTLYKPKERVLSVQGNGTFHLGSSHGESVYRPIPGRR